MPTTSATTQAMLDQIREQLPEQVGQAPHAAPSDTSLRDAFAASLLRTAQYGVLRNTELLSDPGRPTRDRPGGSRSAPPAPPALRPVVVRDSDDITTEWFDRMLRTLVTFAPVARAAVTGGVNSGYYPPEPQSFDKIMSTVPPERLQGRAWRDTTVNLLTSLAPVALHAVDGTMDLTEPGALPRIEVPSGQNTAWWNDVLRVVVLAMPISMSLL